MQKENFILESKSKEVEQENLHLASLKKKLKY